MSSFTIEKLDTMEQ